MLDWIHGFHFVSDGWWVATVIVAIIGVIGSLIVGHDLVYSNLRRLSKRWYVTANIVTMVTVFFIGYTVLAAVSGWASSVVTNTGTTDVRASVLTAHLGLKTDTAYPLVMGSRVGGSTVEASADAGIFSAHAYVNSKPASVVSLSFTVGNKSWILEIPVAKVTFIQSNTADPSVKLHITGKSMDGSWVYHYKGRDCHFHDLLFACPPVRTGQTLKVSESVDRKGLPPIISDYLDSATITLTPAMYKEVLGTP